MQQLANETVKDQNPDAEDPRKCARVVMDVVPPAMRCIRTEMRVQCRNRLSVPQFRTLAYVSRRPGVSLSEVADHIGVTPPTMSRLVDRLVERGLVAREEHPDSRRRLRLSVTTEGKSVFEAAREQTLEKMAERLGALTVEERLAIADGLALLARALPVRRPGEEPGGDGVAAENTTTTEVTRE